MLCEEAGRAGVNAAVKGETSEQSESAEKDEQAEHRLGLKAYCKKMGLDSDSAQRAATEFVEKLKACGVKGPSNPPRKGWEVIKFSTLAVLTRSALCD